MTQESHLDTAPQEAGTQQPVPQIAIHGVHEALAAAGVTLDMLRHPITFFDTETTSLNPREDEIIEFAAMRFEPNEQGTIWTLARTEHQYFVPRVEISSDAAAVHGVTNEIMASMAASGQAVSMKTRDVKTIREVFSDSLIVAHNIMFDMSFLERAFGRFRVPLDGFINTIDTVNYGKLRFPRNKVNLDALCRVMKVSNKARASYHGALVDTEILSRVFEKLVNPPPLADLLTETNAEPTSHEESDRVYIPSRKLVKISSEQKNAYEEFRQSCGVG